LTNHSLEQGILIRGEKLELRLGFIGLGQIGKWIALNIAKAGFALTVYDVNPDPVRELAANGVEVSIGRTFSTAFALVY
jgi:prephenate dehydrogenase